MAWNDTARVEHNRDALRYPSDLTDREWALIAPLLPLAKAAIGIAEVVLRGGPVERYDVALQFLGVIDDQDHLQRAVTDEAALQLGRPGAHRIGVVALAPECGLVRLTPAAAHVLSQLLRPGGG